ncbi:RNA polymerase sigma factor [Novosphingobium resinovorum]|uniref:RNA polymerase sigma factor n=1 Tax=Novosphingobium resinovorum TaxID=158500 RepID=UPI002ED43289|nr:sigma-70 family RNA polymerase sigma factor [Novosphingobium resinovorum]
MGTKGCPLIDRKTQASSQDETPTMRTYMAQRRALADYAAKITGSREQAEDIVQEAWLALSAQRGSGDVRDSVGYLRTIVRNLAIDRLRQRMRESRLLGADMQSATRTVADASATPERETFAKRDLSCVLRVLRSLPERQRLAIEMHRFGDYKLREIADRLGISVSLAHLLISDGITACTVRCGIERIGR